MTKNMENKFVFNWNEIAFSNKKPFKSLKATFISAPRQISINRFKDIIRAYLPSGDIVLGLAKEPYVLGFENQKQFRTLAFADIKDIIDKVNLKSPNKIFVLNYMQHQLDYIINDLNFKKVVFINGSRHKSIHTKPYFYKLINRNIAYDIISPFHDEDEAINYAKEYGHDYDLDKEKVRSNLYSSKEIFKIVDDAAARSFDATFQVGAVLCSKELAGFKPLLASHNRVVPYETYAWHHGPSREKNFSPINDLNHYDTVHAEMLIIIKAAINKENLKNSVLFINVLPCPICARTLCASPISEIYYNLDHSDGYALKMLKMAGKKVKRIVK